MTRPLRIGLIVPSSNTTMEMELPELFRRRERTSPERFSFHSARMRMTQVTPQALATMDRDSEGCAVQLADAECDAVAHACLVATVVAGDGGHVAVSERLSAAIAATGHRSSVVTSAGALVEAIHHLGASRVALVAPYPPALTDRVIGYLNSAGIEVVDGISLDIVDNRRVGHLDPRGLVTLAGRLDLRHAEAIVLSACVQMPSLAAVSTVEATTGLPVLSAATATAHRLLTALGLRPGIPDAGRLLSGAA